jgi:pyruvate kinase
MRRLCLPLELSLPATEEFMTIPRTGPERAAAAMPSSDSGEATFHRSHIPRTKIVGTLGPASNTADGIRALIEARLDVTHQFFAQHARTACDHRHRSGSGGYRTPGYHGRPAGPRIRIGDRAA